MAGFVEATEKCDEGLSVSGPVQVDPERRMGPNCVGPGRTLMTYSAETLVLTLWSSV